MRHRISRKEHYTINFISYLLLFFVALFIEWSQIKTNHLILGTDSLFHINRFYDTAIQIKTGHLSYFSTLFGFNQTGRVVNAVYGPLMAYLSGFLLLICRNWYTFQVVNVLLELSLGGFFMYLLCTHNNIKRGYSLILSIIYMTTYPLSIWITEQEFTGWGAVFIPLAMLCGTNILNRNQIKPVPFALIMSLLIQVHLVSSIIALFALVPILIVGFYRTDSRKHFGIELLQAIGLTIILTANVWGAIIDLFGENNIITPFPQQNIMSSGAVIGFQSKQGLTYLGLIGTGIIVLSLVLFIWHWKLWTFNTKFYCLMGILFLWISSNLFPWHFIKKYARSFISLLQFPKRFLVIAIIAFLLMLGKMVSNDEVHVYIKKLHYFNLKPYIMVLLMIGSIFTITGFIKSDSTENFLNLMNSSKSNMTHVWIPKQKMINKAGHSDNLHLLLSCVDKGTPDYLPTLHPITTKSYYHLHPYHNTYTSFDSNDALKDVNMKVKKHNTLALSGVNNNFSGKTYTLPLTIYNQTDVKVNGKEIKNPKINKVGALRIKLPSGSNTIQTKFKVNSSFYLLIFLSICGWIGLIFKEIINKKYKYYFH